MKLILLFLILSGCVAAQKNMPAQPRVLPQDVLGPYTVSTREDLENFWKTAQTSPKEKWPELFNEMVVKNNQLAYDELVFKGDEQKQRYSERLSHFLDELPKNYEKLDTTFKKFEESAKRQVQLFKWLFKDAKLHSYIYLMVSLRFDGKTGLVNNVPTMAFGMEYFLNSDNAVGIISHELMHLYQRELFGDLNEPTLADKAWQEGLATYSSHLFSRDHRDDASVLLDAKLAESCQKDLKILVKKFSKIVNKKDKKLIDEWFSGQQQNPETPTRAGYCVGYRVVQKLSEKNRSLEMARWPPEVSRKKFIATLSAMASTR